jgi:hypothetical protein
MKNRAQNTQRSCALQSTVVRLYIYIVRLWCFTKHKISCILRQYLKFKSQNELQTVEHDLHIEKSLDIKFYIFLKFFVIFKCVQNLFI